MTDRSTHGRDAARLLAAWAGTVLAMLATGWVVTGLAPASIEPRDDAAARWLASRRTPALDAAAEVGSLLGDTLVGLVLAVVLAAGVSWWQRSRRPAAYVAVVVTGVLAWYVVGTWLISRARPPVRILDPGLVHDHSFPSGHVATSVAVYGSALLLLSWARPRLRRWLLPLLVVPLVVAAARLYQGAHHPTDVVTSLVCTSAWLAAATRVLLGAPPGVPVRRTPPRAGRMPR